MDALAGEVRSQRRGQLDESSRDLDGHTSSVHRAHSNADILHAFGGDVGGGGLEGSPAVVVAVSILRERVFLEQSVTYMIPGATALTRIPLGACCFARARVKVTMAPLVEE